MSFPNGLPLGEKNVQNTHTTTSHTHHLFHAAHQGTLKHPKIKTCLLRNVVCHIIIEIWIELEGLSGRCPKWKMQRTHRKCPIHTYKNTTQYNKQLGSVEEKVSHTLHIGRIPACLEYCPVLEMFVVVSKMRSPGVCHNRIKVPPTSHNVAHAYMYIHIIWLGLSA